MTTSKCVVNCVVINPESHDVFLSVVVPVFNECKGLAHSIHAIRNATSALHNAVEILLVDDGSTDGSWSCIQQLAADDPSIKGIRLSRNYGKEAAIFAGLARSSGAHVLVMDADLQHPPSAIASMLEAYLDQGLDVIDGIKRHRGKESSWYRWSASAFYRIFSRLSGMDLDQASDFKVLSRQVVDELLGLEEKGVFFRGLTFWVGFKHGTYEFDVEQRSHGETSWSMSQLFRLGVNAITSYTSSILQLVSALGLVFLLFAIALGFQTLVNKMAGQAVDGFTTVILLLLIIGAIIMVSLGIIGQYIARIYEEVKRRPRYIIRDET